MKKNRIPMNIRLHPDTAQELKDCSEQKRIDKTTVIELALNDYFRREKCPDRTSETRDTYNAKQGTS